MSISSCPRGEIMQHIPPEPGVAVPRIVKVNDTAPPAIQVIAPGAAEQMIVAAPGIAAMDHVIARPAHHRHNHRPEGRKTDHLRGHKLARLLGPDLPASTPRLKLLVNLAETSVNR